MTQSNLIIAAALVVPVLAFSMPAIAATAHNLETGAHTKNSNDTAASAVRKQRKHIKRM